MKVTLVCLAVLIACVAAEDCRRSDDCSLETCTGAGWTVNCHWGTCTCDHSDHTGSSCSTKDDCSGTHCGNFQLLGAHCIDGNCRCSLGPGGK